MDKDIYLGSGTPSPSTPAGQHLLAHELAHTQQQSGPAKRKLRRLTYDKPIKNVKSIKVVQHGAGGRTAEVSDGKKAVVVKSDQMNAAEVLAANKLQSSGRFRSRGYKVKAPKARIASSADLKELKDKAAGPALQSQDPRNFVTGLDGSNPTLVMEALGGDTMQSQIGAMVSESKGADGSESFTTDPAAVKAIKKLVSSTGAIKAMAKAAGVDAAMGMDDRILGKWNGDNFLFDPKKKTFNFVDNTSKSTYGSLIDKIGDQGLENARAGFEAWLGRPWVGELLQDRDLAAAMIVENFTGIRDGGGHAAGMGIMGMFQYMGRKGREQNAKNDVRDELKAVIDANYAALTAAARAGLDAGIAHVSKQLNNPLAVTKGLTGDTRHQAVTSLLARAAMLKGSATDGKTAWDNANKEAHRLLKTPFKPAAPALDMGSFPSLAQAVAKGSG
jgi:hypothetical protein